MSPGVGSEKGSHPGGGCENQVQGLRAGVTLGSVDVQPQVQGWEMGLHPGTWTNDPKAMAWDVGHPGDFGHVTPGTGSGREESPWGLWTCDPKYSVWERLTLETVDV